MNTINLREEILRITHRWYLILIYILVGALVGWGGSLIWPSPHRATLDLYVGLNAYRSPFDSYAVELSGQSFRMVDDYKNWQMEQLDELVRSDAYLDETMTRLSAEGFAWDGSTQDFRKNLDVLWRNAGVWHLVVDAKDPELAANAVEIWGDVILEFVNKAIEHARQVVGLDIQMTTISESRVDLELQQETLVFIQSELSGIQIELGGMASDQRIPAIDHWKLLALISQVVVNNPGWDNILDDVPEPGSAARSYTSWLEGVLPTVKADLAVIPGKIKILDQSLSTVAEQYEIETAESYGLASTLVVEKMEEVKPETNIVRKPGTFSLVGSFIGFLIWLLREIFRIERNSNNRSVLDMGENRENNPG